MLNIFKEKENYNGITKTRDDNWRSNKILES